MAEWELVHLRPFIPEAWFTKPEESSVWFRIYRAYGLREEGMAATIILLRSPEVVAILFPGSIGYQGFDEPEVTRDAEAGVESWKFNVTTKQTGPGVVAVLMTPYETDGAPEDEAGARERLSVAAGLIASFEPWTLLLEVLFEGPLHVEGDKWSMVAPTITNLDAFGRPRLDRPYRKLMETATQAMEGLALDDRARVRLALRWHDMAVRESNKVDAFLKHWISIETLAMPDDTNIRPVVEALAQHYGLSYEEAKARFQVGRICGRRGNIVHAGDMRPVSLRLLDYMNALFIDLLRHRLGIEAAHRAGRLLEQAEFNLAEYL
jgi:hypothetical protein